MVYLSDFQTLCLLITVGCLAWSSYIDFKKFILPDMLTLAVFLMGVLIALSDPIHVNIVGGAIGAAAGYGASWALRWGVYMIKKEEALGLGDVKLFGAAGMWVGVEGVISVAFYGSLITLLAVLLKAIITRKGSLKDVVPFGPGIAVGIVITILYGPMHNHIPALF